MPVQKIFIEGIPIQTLFDSGASVNAIKTKTLNKLLKINKNLFTKNSDVQISLPGNNTIRATTVVNLHFKLDKFSWTQMFYVIDNLPFDAILGVKALKHCNII